MVVTKLPTWVIEMKFYDIKWRKMLKLLFYHSIYHQFHFYLKGTRNEDKILDVIPNFPCTKYDLRLDFHNIGCFYYYPHFKK